MKASKPIAFILLAFVIGATVSQGSFAFADDSSTNPFRAIWDAIGELQTKTDSLQAQIDDLKSQQETTVPAAQAITKNSESSLVIEIAGGQLGQTLVTLIGRNSGPDNAVGVKLTTFYQTSLFQVNFIQGAECSDGSRGIIECYLGTIAAGSEARVVVDATPISLGRQAIITADLSSITTDTNLANNHAESVFITSTNPEIEQQAPQQPEIQQSSLTVLTDKAAYVLGEPVIISGGIGAAVEGLPIVIQVFNPAGEAYRFTQVNATSLGSYSYTFNIGGDLALSGQYRIVASYGGASAETTLLFTDVQSQATTQPSEVQQEQLSAEQQSSEQPGEQETQSQESESTEQPSESEEGTGDKGEAASDSDSEENFDGSSDDSGAASSDAGTESGEESDGGSSDEDSSSKG